MKPQPPTDDTRDVSILQEALVSELTGSNLIRSPRVEAAFRAVPRHLFVPDVPLEEAYADRSIPTKVMDGQLVSSCSQPSIVAIMLEQLDLEPGHNVLEIGAGTGYNAALMAHIVGETGHVVTMDIDEDTVEGAREHLHAAGFDRVQVLCADGGYGYADAAPYDRIILTVGASDITPAWWGQLKPNGRLVLPLEVGGAQKSIAFVRANDHLVSVAVQGCGFMTLRGTFAAQPQPRVQVGPDPSLYVESLGEQPVDGGAVYNWLTGPSTDWPTGVEVTIYDILGGLGTWLALHEPDLGRLTATGDMVTLDLVPPLIGLGGQWNLVATSVLLKETGLVALMRPPGQQAPMVDINELYASGSRFTLYVRLFGADESLAHHTLGLIRAWEHTGRPSSDDMLIRAYPKGSDYVPSKNEIVVEKQWTRLVIEGRTG